MPIKNVWLALILMTSAVGADVCMRTFDRAIRVGDVTTVSEHLKAHPDLINVVNHRGETPLIRARHEAMLTLLLEHGADLHAVDRDGRTALHQAAHRKRAPLVALLLEHGAKVGLQNREGWTALHYACRGRNSSLEIARLLIDAGADPDIPMERATRCTPFELALASGNIELIRFLLPRSQWANREDSNAQASQVLHAAAESANVEIFQWLLEAGADVNLFNRHGRTPLHEVSRNRASPADLVTLLLEHGADAHAQEKHSLKTPLHDAATFGNEQVTRALIKGGADIHARSRHPQNTPLHDAASFGNTGGLQALLEAGSEVDVVNDVRATPLWLAANDGHTDIARLLIEHGANVNHSDRFGYTPLHVAAMTGDVETLRLLLAHGANPRRRTSLLHSFLVQTVFGGMGDSERKRIGRKSPLDLAIEYGHTEAADVLRGP